MTEWQPIETAPKEGKFLVASYAPTNWAYTVLTVVVYEDMPKRLREIRLQYATAWMPLPPPPETSK